MFSLITNIYNKKTEGPTLMELFTATGKLFFFLTTEMFDMCTTGDTANIETIYKFLPHTRKHSASIFFAATMFRAFRSARSHGSGGTNIFAYSARNARCTVTTGLLVWYSNTQNDFSPGAAIFSLHTLASPSGRNVNYDERQFTGGKRLSCSFYLYRFRKYPTYGFPLINYCNPGVHCDTPCTYSMQV